MPLITAKISYTAPEQKTINDFFSAGLSFRDWGCDELQDIRSKIREFYRVAQHGKCCYCMKSISLQSAGNAHVEHILPKSIFMNFIFEPGNLCVICAECNNAKNNGNVINDDEPNTCNGQAARYPRVSNRFKIIHPHLDEYNDHIIRSGIFYIDKTKKGHFTIGACKLNIAIHKFGHEEGVIDDFDLFKLMEKFQNGSKDEQKEVFGKIRSLIPRPL